MRRAVALDGHAMLDRNFDELLPARGQRIAIAQVAAGRMSPDAAQRVFERPSDPRGLAGFVQFEPLMNRADHDVELLEDGIGPIERAVRENVDFTAAQNAD